MAETRAPVPDWDAATYDRISTPQQRWGSAVLDRVRLHGDERVLDAGCGSGRVTGRLAAMLPHGTVVALDASAAMLEQARSRLADLGPRVEFVHADLGAPLPLAHPVDAVVSTATFHWVIDHDALFRNLAAVLRPGGRLVAQCGGEGNLDVLGEAVRRAGGTWPGPWTFASAETTHRRLEDAGFVDVDTWLHDEPAQFPTRPELETFIATVCLRPLLASMPATEHAPFVSAVADELGTLELDYVRLDIDARRS